APEAPEPPKARETPAPVVSEPPGPAKDEGGGGGRDEVDDDLNAYDFLPTDPWHAREAERDTDRETDAPPGPPAASA
ncbi:hypothetical protein LRE75_37855, partial [Streptomyces sp. 372A]